MQCTLIFLTIILLDIFKLGSCGLKKVTSSVTSKRKYEDDSLQRRLESKYGNGCDTTFMLVSEASKNESLAKALGYILGLGSSQVYVPVLIDLWRRRSTDGYSLATFCSTSGGLICNALYSMKRGYHISSYADTLSLVVQGLSCVTFVCILDGLQLPLFVYNLNSYKLE